MVGLLLALSPPCGPAVNLSATVAGAMRSSRHLAAIVFTDMVGFTASAQSDEAAALSRLGERRELSNSV